MILFDTEEELKEHLKNEFPKSEFLYRKMLQDMVIEMSKKIKELEESK